MQGLIMVSIDKNPRAVYEAVTGGLPVFVSDAAQVVPLRLMGADVFTRVPVV